MPSPSSPRHRSDYSGRILEAAGAICERDLATHVGRPSMLHLRGLLLSRQRGYMAAAIACLERCVRIRPDCAAYWVSLGDVLGQVGRDQDCLSAYLRAVTLVSESTALYMRLGEVLFRQGRLAEAVATYERACQLRPGSAPACRSVGAVLFEQGRNSQSLAAFERALQLDPNDAATYHGMGAVWLSTGEPRLALECFRRGLRFAPDDPNLHAGVGEAFLALGDTEAAIQAFRTALAIDVHHLSASRQLVRALDTPGRGREAAGAWFHLGTVYQATLAYEESAEAYQQAVASKPDSLPAAAGLAHMYLACGRPADSLGWLRRVSPRAAQDSAVHVDLASAHHLLGDISQGWSEYAFFYHDQECRRRGWECPLWDGAPLGGRTILLWPDMGRGDAIHFLRYIPIVKAQGGRVLVQAHHPGLAPLIARIPGVDRVVLPEAPLPHFDVHAPLNFFPAYFPALGSPLAAGVPYLTVDPELAARWKQKVGPHEGRTIGLSWGGNTVTRSAPSRFVSLASFAPLGRGPRMRYVSLQHGPQAAELLALPHGLSVKAVMDGSSSILDAAAVVLSLDLVITVDTMIAHLAGALGKPVWTLLRYATNWRWQHDGESSPWYPTMRLFRQKRSGDWGDVFDRVQAALEDFPRKS